MGLRFARIGFPFAVATAVHIGLVFLPVYAAEPIEHPKAVNVRLPPPPEPPEPTPPEPEPEPEPEVEPPPPEPEPTPAPTAEPKPEPKPEPPPKSAPTIDPVPDLPTQTPAKQLPTLPKSEPTPEPVKPRPKGDAKAALKAYGRGVHRSMESHKRYPLAARKLGYEGDVIVKIKIDRQGQLIGKPTIARSCGHEVLDKEALRMVEKAAPFEALPETFEKDQATIKLPVRFRLQSQ